jgi:hypothetical protein
VSVSAVLLLCRLLLSVLRLCMLPSVTKSAPATRFCRLLCRLYLLCVLLLLLNLYLLSRCLPLSPSSAVRAAPATVAMCAPATVICCCACSCYCTDTLLSLLLLLSPATAICCSSTHSMHDGNDSGDGNNADSGMRRQ